MSARRKQSPKRHSAYVVTSSSQESVEVGQTLIDKGNQLFRTWEWLDMKNGTFTGATGQRLVELCGPCRTEHKVIGLRDHEGEHGGDEVKAAARVAIDRELKAWRTDQAALLERIQAKSKEVIEEVASAEG